MDETDTQAVENQAPEQQADTAQTQTQSEASESSTNAPEATQDKAPAQEAEAPEVKAEDTAEEKLLAGKYKTPEDLEKAYKELESKYGSTNSEKAELTRILNEAFAPPAQQEQTQQQDTANDDFEEPISGTNPEVEAMKRDLALTKFIINHQNMDGESGEAMKEVLLTDPIVRQINGHEAKLEYAYLRSQNMSQTKAIKQAKEEGAKLAQTKAAEKSVAQVESAKKAEPVDEGKELLSKASGGSPDEAKAAREALIRKHLVNL